MKTSRVGAVALLVGFMLGAELGCSGTKSQSSEQSNVGEVGLSLLLAPGVQVSSVSYIVRNDGGGTVAKGSIPVSDPGATLSLLVGGLTAGSGYTVEMHAESTSEPTVTCVGVSLPFDVTAGSTAVAHVDLECTGEEARGEVRLDGTWNNCPEIVSYTAAPLTALVGRQIALTSAAADADNFGGNTDPQHFFWTATQGNFGSSGSSTTMTANATYTCTEGGTATITLTVSDGDPSLPGPCSDSTSFTVQCFTGSCGNGVVESPPFDNCDDGNTESGDDCPSDCTLPVCGDGVIENATGFPLENCDPPGANCPTDCSMAVCGDGAIEGNEQCDVGPGGSATCTASCQICAGCSGIMCGDGVVERDEECDPGTSLPTADCGNGYDRDGAGPLGRTAACRDVTSTSCEACEASACPEHIDSCDSLTGVATTGPGAGMANKTLCYEALECVRNEGCVGQNGVLDCFCGSTTSTTCLVTPNGACKDVLLRALLTSDPLDAAWNFGDIARPGGWAVQRAICDFDNCVGQGCF